MKGLGGAGRGEESEQITDPDWAVALNRLSECDLPKKKKRK